MTTNKPVTDRARQIVDAVVEHCEGADFGYDEDGAVKAVRDILAGQSVGDDALREKHRRLALFHASGGHEVTWEEVDAIVAEALATPAPSRDEVERT